MTQGHLVIGKGRSAAQLRNIEIAKIKIGCGPKGLALDDGTYRALLERLTGKRSAADLDWRERAKVIAYLNGQTSAALRRPANEWAFVDGAQAECKPLLRKILMQARAAGIARGQQVAYVEGIARQMAGLNASGGSVDHPLRMCSYVELWRIVAALDKHLKKMAASSGSPKA